MSTIEGPQRRQSHAGPELAVVSRTGRRRRPSGEPPPLPHPLSASGWFCLAVASGVAASWSLLYLGFGTTPVQAVVRSDIAVLGVIERLRIDALSPVMADLHALGSAWVMRALRWTTLITLVVLRRFRHLFVLVAVIMVVTAIVTTSSLTLGRMRPVDIEIIGVWDGYSHPSAPVVGVALSLVGVLYTLVPSGRWRNRAKWVAGTPIVALCVARLYLGVDHPSDIMVALILGVAVPVLAFRLVTPNEIFPITYRRGRSAHLDVGGRRGEAIAQALHHQLGFRVVEVTPFRLEGSAGSTPLRIVVRHGPQEVEGVVFAKLYARNHLRSDRWYKLGRTILYGRLEDEGPFSSVRRLVEYEDYLLRVMADAGLPVPMSYGFVEITPEREYLMVTEFLEGAVELDDADVDVDDAVIDDALVCVRRMWDTGLAHRDVKPANVMLREGRVILIDVAFATVRPTPWRQAVDLINMMLTLALRSDAERVYQRALVYFDPGDIAEAVAASRSVTIPAQLRQRLRDDGRDLLGRFRELAPERAPIAIQAWSLRRLGLTLATGATIITAGALLAFNLRTAGLL